MGASCGNVKRKVCFVRVKWQVDTDIRERGCNVALMNATGQCILKGKGKVIPLQAWTGPEGSRRLRLPDFKTIGT